MKKGVQQIIIVIGFQFYYIMEIVGLFVKVLDKVNSQVNRFGYDFKVQGFKLGN